MLLHTISWCHGHLFSIFVWTVRHGMFADTSYGRYDFFWCNFEWRYICRIQWSSSKECSCTVPTFGLFCYWNIWKYTYTTRLAKTTSLKWCPYFLMPFSSLMTIVVHTGFCLSAAVLQIDSYRSCNKRSFLGYTYISTRNNHTYLDLVIMEGRRHAQTWKKIRTLRQYLSCTCLGVLFSSI